MTNFHIKVVSDNVCPWVRNLESCCPNPADYLPTYLPTYLPYPTWCWLIAQNYYPIIKAINADLTQKKKKKKTT
jgi:hypothetical protein